MVSSRTGDRFWTKVGDADANGCWLWQGGTNGEGYGAFTAEGKRTLAHRYAFERMKGEIPAGLTLDHLCRVRLCVNPDHLEPVTNKENVLRGTGISARNARKTHCAAGHPLEGSNLVAYELKRGRRQCKTCQTARFLRYQRVYRALRRISNGN